MASSSSGSGSMTGDDVLIVGGGIMGSAVALRLAQRGVGVTVIERGIPGAEASSAAAGMLAPQTEADGPGPMLALGLKSRALYPELAVELREATGIDVGYQRSGVLALGFGVEDERTLSFRRTWQVAQGQRAELLAEPALRTLEPALGPSVRAALHFPDDAQVNPAALARAFSQAAAAAGARFLQGRYVRRVVVEQGAVTGLELDGEVLSTDRVVLAAGSWSGLVEGGGVPASVVRPARGQLVAIATRTPLFHHELSVHGRGYLVTRRAGTVVAGSTVEKVGFRKEVTVGGLATILDLARTLVPGLADAFVMSSWSNFRPYTEDQLPVLGASRMPLRWCPVAKNSPRTAVA